MALLYCSRVFFESSRCCFQASRPVYPRLQMSQRALDERFTLPLAISQIISRHTPTSPNSFNRLSSFVAATEASMRFSAVLPAIASSSQPVPCSDSNSNSNSNDITNMTSVENTGLVDGSTIVEGAMSLGG